MGLSRRLCPLSQGRSFRFRSMAIDITGFFYARKKDLAGREHHRLPVDEGILSQLSIVSPMVPKSDKSSPAQLPMLKPRHCPHSCDKVDGTSSTFGAVLHYFPPSPRGVHICIKIMHPPGLPTHVTCKNLTADHGGKVQVYKARRVCMLYRRPARLA